jgi:hypothetical protein
MEFIHDSSVPHTLVSDSVPEETHGATSDLCRKYHIKQRVTVPHSPWKNLAEAVLLSNDAANGDSDTPLVVLYDMVRRNLKTNFQ